MTEIESRFEGGENATAPPHSGQLLALVDALHSGTLNDAQQATVHALRAGILALAENGSGARVHMVWRRCKRLLYCKYPREGGRGWTAFGCSLPFFCSIYLFCVLKPRPAGKTE